MNDPTPRALQDFRFTPSLMDPNSFSFMNIANQPPGYYTPTSSGMNTIYHHQAGDLHTPTLGFNLVTPLSIPNTLSGALPTDPNADMNMHGFPNQFLPHQFHNMNPFAQQTSYAPSQFMNRDSAYDPMDRAVGNPMDAMNMHINGSMGVVSSNASFSEHMDVTSLTDGEKYVFLTFCTRSFLSSFLDSFLLYLFAAKNSAN